MSITLYTFMNMDEIAAENIIHKKVGCIDMWRKSVFSEDILSGCVNSIKSSVRC